MIDFACPTNEEIALLKQHYQKGTGKVSQRAHALLLAAAGKTAYDISQVLFNSEKTIRSWLKLWRQKRLAAIFSQHHANQNAAKLTKEQKVEVARALSSPPSAYGLPKEFWDVSALKSYLTAYFGVIYESPQSYHFLFKTSHFSFKLPAKFDLHRDEELVKKRIGEIRATLAPLFNDPAVAILVSDESRVVWESIIRRCWLPKGRKSILKVNRENIAQNFVGFLDLKSGQPHLFAVPWQNQKEIIKVLKKLRQRYSGQKICLVWDNAGFHKGKEIRGALRGSLSNYFLLNFPPYAPDTNPQEHIWRWSKDQIANHQFSSLRSLALTFRKIVMSRKYPYQI